MDREFSKKDSRAFTQLEVMIAVAFLAILAEIAGSSMHRSTEAAKLGKLRADVAALNSAVRVYQASGGNLGSALTPAAVLTMLKSQAAAGQEKRLTGVSSPVIDTRLAFRMQSAVEGAGSDPRVHWNQTETQFLIASSGAAGIKEFYFVEGGTSTGTVPTTDQRAGSMLYSQNSGWIWDFQDRALEATIAPTQVALGTSIDPVVVAPTPTPSPPPPAAPSPLATPVFSQAGATYLLNQFPLPVTITDPNPTGASKVMVSIDAGAWQDYGAPISVSAGSNIRAVSVALASEWTNSGSVSHDYLTQSVQLLEPLITPSSTTFGLFYGTDITVTLSDPNEAGTSVLQYRTNGGPWENYASPFVLVKSQFPEGVIVEAQAISAGSPDYLASPVAQQFLGRESLNLTGSTSGYFHTPIGPAGMISNLAGGGSNSHFDWGDATGSSAYSKSWMDYTGSPIADIADGVRFNVGSLTYYNGTIQANTGADTIDLNIELSLNINGNVFNPFFEFTFELINSANVAGDAWGSADYVRLADPRASRTLVVNGYEFEFRVEFGETSPDGFAEFNEFYVLENKDASVNVYGTLISLGPVATNSDPLKGGNTIALDPGTGTAGDALFQKEGYVDAVEYVDTTIGSDAEVAVTIARDARDVAIQSANDALQASVEISPTLSSGDSTKAAQLDTDATAAATAADSAAATAEAARADAYDAAVAAQTVVSDNPDDPELEKRAMEVIDQATLADTYATEARTAAGEATKASTDVSGTIASFAIFGTGAVQN